MIYSHLDDEFYQSDPFHEGEGFKQDNEVHQNVMKIINFIRLIMLNKYYDQLAPKSSMRWK